MRRTRSIQQALCIVETGMSEHPTRFKECCVTHGCSMLSTLTTQSLGAEGKVP